MDVEKHLIAQEENDSLRVAVAGQVPDKNGCVQPIVHDGRVILQGGNPQHPFVHRLDWEHKEGQSVHHRGELVHVGDGEKPIPLVMHHSSEAPVELDLRVKQLDHDLAIATTVQDPLHHALQLKTPIQLRFVNPWEARSRYHVAIRMGTRTLFEIELSGTTDLVPKPAPVVDCSAAPHATRHDDQIMVDLLGRKDSQHG